jgi:hypothetical protein
MSGPPPDCAIVYVAGTAALRLRRPAKGICGKKVVIVIKGCDWIISAFDWTAFFGAFRPAACR